MAEHGEIQITIPGPDGEPQMSKTTFILQGTTDTPTAARLFRPLPDGTTQEIIVGVTVEVHDTPETKIEQEN